MTITQEQYEAYVRAEDAWYRRIFIRFPFTNYNTVGASWPNIDGVTPLKQIYRQLNRLELNPTPRDRLSVRQTVNSLLSSPGLRSLITSEPFLESLGIELRSIIGSIQNAATGDIFIPPANSPANFYQTYINQQSNPPSSPSPSNGGSASPSTSPTPTETSSTSAVSNCYEKNGVVMTIEEKVFYLKLLPAIQSNIPMQGSSETPNTAPGLHIKIIPNLARLRIPGFAPVYQHLGIDSALITLVGTFVPEDGENPDSFTNVTGFAPPSNINDQTASDQIRNSELERSSYLAASKFYDFAVKTGGEVSVYINVPENVNLDSNPFVLNKRPGFKGIIKSMDLFHRNRYRTWYSIQFEVSDFGMYSSTPLDMNQDINQAIQERIEAENQDRVEETQSNLNDRIGDRNLISYNDAENPGYFRSGDSYYFRFADPQSCRRTYLSALTILRCDNEQWVEVSGIDGNEAIQFARDRTLPVGAEVSYPSYEKVRDIRRNGYQQFSLNGASIRQVDGSDITGAEYANIAIQGGTCLGSAVATKLSAAGTVAATATGVAAVAAGPLSATTVGLGAATLASCSFFLASARSALNESRSGAPDENEGVFEGVILPIGVDLGVGLAGRALAPVLKTPIGNFFRGSSAATKDLNIPPPGTSQFTPPPVDPTPASPVSPPGPISPPISPTTPPTSSAPSPPVSNSRPVTTPPNPTPPVSNIPPSDFTPTSSTTVSAAIRSISANDINVVTEGNIIPLSRYFSERNINSVLVRIDSTGSIDTLNIDSSGNLAGSEETINFIRNKLTLSIASDGTLY